MSPADQLEGVRPPMRTRGSPSMKGKSFSLLVAAAAILSVGSCAPDQAPAPTTTAPPPSNATPTSTTTVTPTATITPTSTPVVPTVPPPIIDPNFPGSPDATEIVEVMLRAQDAEIRALCYFDLTEFPSAYVNDPRFPVPISSYVNHLRELAHIPRIESPGELNSQLAFWGWRAATASHLLSLRATATAENRDLTAEEKALLSEETDKGAIFLCNTIAPLPIEFQSLEVDNDVATIEVMHGVIKFKVILVRLEDHWFIAEKLVLWGSP
jgi:hypothetical protein